MQRVWVRELAGWLSALAIAVVVTGQVASSARAELLFRDGDSLIVAMLARSLLAGDQLDWAMSSVLFLPESIAFTGLDAALPLSVDDLLAVSAVVNLIALYGAIRMVAGRSREGAAPVAWSVVAIAAFGVLAITETSASRDALDLASLQLTTTYYSATVVGVVLTMGLVRRHLDGQIGSQRARPFPIIGVAAVAAISTLSNPLYAVWATVPLTVLLSIGAVRATRRMLFLLPLTALLAGTAVGFLARIPLAAWIANTGAGYAHPERWPLSLTYYAELLGDRLATPLGVLGSVLLLALLVLAVVRSVRRADAGARLVAASAWTIPLLVIIGAIALGTNAARYLQPVVFAPVLAIVAAPRVLRMPRTVSRAVLAGTASVLLIGGALSVPRLTAAAQTPDADLACVVDWVNATGRTGAGQFWTVRLPKAHVDDPSRLVQVDHRLNGYAWLVNRTDFTAREVAFLVEDVQSARWDLSESALPVDVINCGRYSILDYGDAPLTLGTPHS